MIVFELILGIIVAIICYNLIHHFLVVIPSKKRQLKVKDKINFIIQKIIKDMIYNNKINSFDINSIQSNILSNAWGREVFAFEYSIPISFKNKQQQQIFFNEFKEELNIYSINHSMIINNNKSIFEITDIWQYDHQTHIDIAYLSNQITKEYLRDLKKL